MTMDINKILRALEDAQYLIDSEYQSLCDEELELEYQDVMDEIAEAIAEINNSQHDD